MLTMNWKNVSNRRLVVANVMIALVVFALYGAAVRAVPAAMVVRGESSDEAARAIEAVGAEVDEQYTFLRAATARLNANQRKVLSSKGFTLWIDEPASDKV